MVPGVERELGAGDEVALALGVAGGDDAAGEVAVLQPDGEGGAVGVAQLLLRREDLVPGAAEVAAGAVVGRVGPEFDGEVARADVEFGRGRGGEVAAAVGGQGGAAEYRLGGGDGGAAVGGDGVAGDVGEAGAAVRAVQVQQQHDVGEVRVGGLRAGRRAQGEQGQGQQQAGELPGQARMEWADQIAVK